MDNKGKVVLVGFISFVAGVAAGGAGMYFYSKKYFQDKADAEIQEMCDYYISKYEGGSSKDDKKDESKSAEEVETEKEAKVQAKYEAISDIYKSDNNESDRVNTSYSKYYDDNSDDSAPKKKKTSKKKKVDIEIVDQEVWDENPGNFESRFLVYYDPDNVLIDEESEKLFEENNDIVKIVNLHSDDAVDGVLILQDNVNKFLYHVTVEQMSYMEQLSEEDD